jgi:hypothetical protein
MMMLVLSNIIEQFITVVLVNHVGHPFTMGRLKGSKPCVEGTPMGVGCWQGWHAWCRQLPRDVGYVVSHALEYAV